MAASRKLLGDVSWSLGSEAAAVGLGQAVAVAGAIIGVRFLTEFLDPAEYGELALGMSASMLAVQVVLGPVNAAANRFFAPALEAHELRGYLRGLRSLTIWSFAALAIFAAATTVVAFARYRDSLNLVTASFAYAFAAGVVVILGGVQHAARQRIVASAHEAVGPWIRVGGAIALMELVRSRTSGVAMIAYAATSVLVAISQLLFFRSRIVSLARQERAPVGEKWYGQMKSYALPFVTWGLFSWAHLVSDRWALEAFATTSDVGFFSVLYQLGFYPLTLASTLLVQVGGPVLYARAGDGSDAGRVREAFRLNGYLAAATLGIAAVAATAAAFVHPLIGRLLLAESYRGITFLFPYIVLAGGLFATGQVISLVFMVANRSRELILPKIATSLFGVVLNVVGARFFGLTGVIAASVAYSVVYLGWMSIHVRRTFAFGAEK